MREDGGVAAELRRAAVAVALLVVAALGTGARERAHLSRAGMLSGSSPVTTGLGAGVVVAACLAVAVLVVMLARRWRAGQADRRRLTSRQRTLVFAAMLAAAALLAVVLAVALHDAHGAYRRHLARGPARHHHHLAAVGASGGSAVLLAGAALAAAAMVAAVIWWRRRRGPGGGTAQSASVAESPLAAAITAGVAALAEVAGARQAIIACYAAMEDALATAGTPRLAADTPEELLARAQDGGVLATPAAARLTELFREARFSPHMLGEPEREAAATALRDIGRELGGQQ